MSSKDKRYLGYALGNIKHGIQNLSNIQSQNPTPEMRNLLRHLRETQALAIDLMEEQ